MLTFRTSTPNGLLFYTGSKDQMMIAAYLQNGILKFKVSCGLQIILFSDPRDRVDSGFQQSVRIRLELESPTMCSTVIQLNDTHTMKGEQEIVDMPLQPDKIYFGLMPYKRDPEIDIVHSGFQGCMNYLQVLNRLDICLNRRRRGDDWNFMVQFLLMKKLNDFYLRQCSF